MKKKSFQAGLIFPLILILLTGCFANPSVPKATSGVSPTGNAASSVAPDETPDPSEESLPSFSPAEPLKDIFQTAATELALNGCVNRGISIADGTAIYLQDKEWGVHTLDMTAGTIEKVTTSSLILQLISLYNGYLYCQAPDGSIIRFKTDGTGQETLFTPKDLQNFVSCQAVGQYIYYNYGLLNRSVVYQINMETGAVTESGISTDALASDGQSLYCALVKDGKTSLCRSAMDGSGITVILPGAKPSFIIVSGDWIYYADNANKIFRVKKDGSGNTQIGATTWPCMFNIAGDSLYYANPSDYSRLYRMKTDGTQAAKLNDAPNVLQVAISLGRVFFDYADATDAVHMASVMPDGSGAIGLDTLGAHE